MRRITEDYVSFETAKLLKEKGFEGYSIITIYDEDALNAYAKELQEKHLPYSSDDPKLKEFYYTKPTLQMAMKWLREVYKILILVEYDCPVFSSDIYKMDDIDKYGSAKHISPTFANCKNYEQACEAAIKYSLENLI